MTRQEGRRQTPTGGKESCSGCSDTAASHQRSEGGGTNRPGWEAGRKPHRYWHEDRKTPCVFSLPHTATRGRCEPSGSLLKLLACCRRTHRQTHRHTLSSTLRHILCVLHHPHPTPIFLFPPLPVVPPPCPIVTSHPPVLPVPVRARGAERRVIN